jgi:DNA-directed RNA polymerase specialized sigma24 family protein
MGSELTNPHDLTELLREWRGSTRFRNVEKADPLFRRIYEDLEQISASVNFLHGIEPAELVNNLYLKWHDGAALPNWDDRIKFYRLAKCALRRLVIDLYRQEKRAGIETSLEGLNLAGRAEVPYELADDIMDEIGDETPTFGTVLLLKANGCTDVEVAEALGVPEIRAKRYWAAAKAEFKKRLQHRLIC